MWNCYPNHTALSFCASLSHLALTLVPCMFLVLCGSFPLHCEIDFDKLNRIPSYAINNFWSLSLLGEVGVEDHTYRCRGSRRRPSCEAEDSGPPVIDGRARLGRGCYSTRSFSKWSHHNTLKSIRSPSGRRNVTAFERGGSKSELLLAVPFHSFLVPVVFEILPWSLPAQAILCPCSND